MELAGSEKKIQALFRELRIQDERVAPGFLRVWNHVPATTPRPLRTFKISFAVGLALLVVIALGSFLLRSRNWQRGQQPNPSLVGGSTTPALIPVSVPPPATPEPKQLALDEPRNRIRFNRRRLAAHRRAEMLAVRQAEIHKARAIASWQSPTATLMHSPAEDVLASLPQLNQSVTELKSFLPNTPE